MLTARTALLLLGTVLVNASLACGSTVETPDRSSDESALSQGASTFADCPNLSGTYYQNTKMGKMHFAAIRQTSCDELFIGDVEVEQGDFESGAVHDLDASFRISVQNEDRKALTDACSDGLEDPEGCKVEAAKDLCRHESVVPADFCSFAGLFKAQGGASPEIRARAGNDTLLMWLGPPGLNFGDRGELQSLSLDANRDLQVTYTVGGTQRSAALERVR
jgi:hypothetical protein